MKSKRHVKRVSANLDLLHFPAPLEDPVRPPCLHCNSPLTLNLPDLESPERLIGVCERCKYWYLIDLLPDLTEGVMVRLPGSAVIRELSRENPSGGISLMIQESNPGPMTPPGSVVEPGGSP